MNLTQKMQKVQEELKAPKNQYNSFGKYKYRSFEDILEALKPILAKHEMAVSSTDEIIHIAERYYVKATVTLSDGSDEISCSACAREPLAQKGMNESQITGSASSYARKYAISGLLAIDDNKDSDATNKNGENKAKTKQDEIVDMAFLTFESNNQAVFTEPAMLNFEFSRQKFVEAIIKHFKKLPTRKDSIKKILETVKPEEVLAEKEQEND